MNGHMVRVGNVYDENAEPAMGSVQRRLEVVETDGVKARCKVLNRAKGCPAEVKIQCKRLGSTAKKNYRTVGEASEGRPVVSEKPEPAMRRHPRRRRSEQRPRPRSAVRPSMPTSAP